MGAAAPTTPAHAAAATTLDAALKAGVFPDHRIDFPASILAAYKRGKATEKQLIWLNKLAAEVTAPKPAAVPLASPAKLDAILGLFAKAAARLQFPSIVLDADGEALKLAPAGMNAKEPGTVNVTRAGPYSDKAWFGRIRLDGSFQPSPKTKMGPKAMQLLAEFAADPIGVAKTQGQRQGACCFCRIRLVHASSLAVGYGPDCAVNYGLPWGAK